MNETAADMTTVEKIAARPGKQNYMVDVLRESDYLGRHPARDVGTDRMRIEASPLGLHKGDFIILEILPRDTGVRLCREARVCQTDASGVTLRLLPSKPPTPRTRH